MFKRVDLDLNLHLAEESCVIIILAGSARLIDVTNSTVHRGADAAADDADSNRAEPRSSHPFSCSSSKACPFSC